MTSKPWEHEAMKLLVVEDDPEMGKLVERGLAASRERARALILAGKVLVDGKPASKAGDTIFKP